jgi:hypothetical protein
MTRRIPLVALALAVAIGACGDDDDDFPGGGATVGAACVSDSQCAFRCARGGHYPGGMCTVPCSDDFDCPSGTACVDDEGGICAVVCDFDGNCGSFGPEYRCDSTRRRGAGGEIRVCRNP